MKITYSKLLDGYIVYRITDGLKAIIAVDKNRIQALSKALLRFN